VTLDEDRDDFLRERIREVARLFLRLGFTAFGGPAAHIAMMEREVVYHRQWLDRKQFLDLVAAVNFIPGPNSTELAIHIGLLRAGFAGLVTAGVCFITPAVLIILPLAFFYVRGGALPQVSSGLGGINACVIAIIAVAALRFVRTSVTDVFAAVLLMASVVAGFLTNQYPDRQPELIILATAATFGAIYYGGPPKVPNAPAVMLLLPLVSSRLFLANLGRTALLFLRVGATLFGSGYVLVSYLQTGLVDQYHWLTKKELLDAIAVGQVTPGPLLTTATFVGYVLGAEKFGGGVMGGIACGLVATIAIFLPSFFFVALLGRVLPRIRRNRYAAGALKGMNAAVAALIIVVCWRLGAAAMVHDGTADWFSIAVAALTLLVLLVWDVNTTWLILASALAGVVRLQLVHG
jgi:chromate transporter